MNEISQEIFDKHKKEELEKLELPRMNVKIEKEKLVFEDVKYELIQTSCL